MKSLTQRLVLVMVAVVSIVVVPTLLLSMAMIATQHPVHAAFSPGSSNVVVANRIRSSSSSNSQNSGVVLEQARSSSSLSPTSTARFMHNNNSSDKKKKKKSSNGGGGGGFASALQQLQSKAFPYAGELRPGKQSPQRVVLDASIVKPDYWQTGTPRSGSKKPLLPWMIEVKTAEEIVKMREAGRLARHVLDTAGRAVAPGVTTDYIDSLVHEEIIKVCTHYISTIISNSTVKL